MLLVYYSYSSPIAFATHHNAQPHDNTFVIYLNISKYYGNVYQRREFLLHNTLVYISHYSKYHFLLGIYVVGLYSKMLTYVPYMRTAKQ